jgi:hypothetical protein
VFAAVAIPSMEQDVMPASRISLFVLFMVIDESSLVLHLFQI